MNRNGFRFHQFKQTVNLGHVNGYKEKKIGKGTLILVQKLILKKNYFLTVFLF